ncbi:hypothetical protein BCM14_2684 [Jezberella montanilacus]|jgi:hypothetical protein|uniref:Uncharacterized protein n=1 Tax=Jezberella montanilacus TaxID=323426 RepID=A0A2T0XBZ5_9BURK|nr:hypothetical protein [Jezberella montanilacus]PRY96446.1 hypothetical protein BCM14_2684 [Jezberella montanilacus]
MTAQFTEVLHYKGEQMSLRTQPLSEYLYLMDTTPDFKRKSTACWRRYVGKWEILLDRLYLVGIHATYTDGTAVTLDSLFPGFPERVFAHWYSGVLSIPQGAMTQYVHMGYLSTYERDLFIAVENGVVVDTQLRINNVSLGEGDNIA